MGTDLIAGDFDINTACYEAWHNTHYWVPTVPTYQSFLVSQDRGKTAFNIVKKLHEKKLINLASVEDFIKAMDTVMEQL